MAQEDPWWKDSPVVAQTPQQGGAIYIPPDPAIAAEKQAEAARQAAAEGRAARGEVRSESAEARAAQAAAMGSATEQQSASLLGRIEGGFSDIQEVIARSPQSQEPGVIESIRGGLSPTGFGGLVTRQIADADRRIVHDSQVDILDALLTLGTGAAYNREQLEGQLAAYFPAYGDTQDEIAVKNRRLKRQIEVAKLRAGPLAGQLEAAIAPYLGATDGGEPADRAVAPGAIEPARGVGLSERDLSLKSELEGAWAGGASIEDLDAINAKYGRPPFPQSERETLQGLRPGQPVQFDVKPSGEATPLGAAAASPVGAYFVGAANALTSGAMDELAPALGLSAEQVQRAKDALREKYPVASFAGEVSGSVLQQAGLGKAIGAAGIAAPRAATAAGLASGVSYGAGEAPEGERLRGAAIGLGGALAGEGLGRLLLRPGAREAVDAAADRAGVPPEALEQVLADIVPPSPRQVIEAGAETGIPIMTSDVRPPRTFIGESARRMGERVPFVGTGSARAAQQEARADAVSSFLREQDIPDDVKARIVTDLSETRKADITKYTQLKEGVFNGLRDAGPVPASNTLAAIDKQIAKLSTAQTEAADEAIAALNQIRENVQGRDILAMEAFRADELANAWKKDGITPGAMGRIEKAVKSLYGPFNEDMGAFIKEVGGATDYNKWRVANARLAEGAQEVTQTALKNVLRTGDATPEVIDRLLFSAKKSDVARLYRNLSPVGRSNARLAIIERIGRDMGPEVSPEKFVTALRKNADQAGIFFTGEQAKQAAGLVRALQATRRGAGARLATATGQENYAPIAVAALADAFGGGGAASAALGTVGISSRIYESAAIRNLLVKLGEVKAGSMAEGALLRQLGEAFPKAAATIGATRATETAEPDVRVIPQ